SSSEQVSGIHALQEEAGGDDNEEPPPLLLLPPLRVSVVPLRPGGCRAPCGASQRRCTMASPTDAAAMSGGVVRGPAGNNDCRIYVGNLPPDIRTKDVEDVFYKYGAIRDIDLKNRRGGPPFAFIEFEDPR
ncbi:hypothetical protein CRUP_022660, partial [Coryphaenoides rupestris]